METNKEKINFKVIRVKQPMGDFFIGNIRAQDLVTIAHADVRRIDERDVEKYIGIQRPLDQGRVANIKKYLLNPNATFPTGVVLALDEDNVEFDEEKGELILQAYTDPEGKIKEIKEAAKVLDGQHRIHAFMNKLGDFENPNGLFSDEFEFNAVIFIGIDIDQQANIFATVNLSQRPVNKSLVYDLEGLSKTRSPFKTAHLLAVALDSTTDGPLENRIKRLGVKTQGRTEIEPLTQQGFVEALVALISKDPHTDRTILMKKDPLRHATSEELQKVPFRNLFIDAKDNEIGLIVHNYFDAIRETWPQAWAAKSTQGNMLPRNNAFKALMRYLRIIYVDIVKDEFGRVVKKDDFKPYFSKLGVLDADFTTSNFKPGSGGESAFFKLLTGKVTMDDLKNV